MLAQQYVKIKLAAETNHQSCKPQAATSHPINSQNKTTQPDITHFQSIHPFIYQFIQH